MTVAGDTASTKAGAKTKVERDRNISKRGRNVRPMALACLGLASVSFLFWLFSRHPAQLVITLALVLATVLDAITAHRTLANPVLELHNPVDGVVGHDLTYFVRMPGLLRPVFVTPPGTWGYLRPPPVAINSDRPGALVLPAPPRGVIRYLIFDVTARGPLGLFQVVRRIRVWLPTPMFVGPAPMEHEIDWSEVRSVRLGSTEKAPHGEELFRGIRPYQRGDAPRSVHWAATAHHGNLMVKEADGTGIIALRIVLHLSHPGTAAEFAASRAAWLAEEALHRGWLVQLVTMETIGAPPEPPALVSPSGPLPLSPLPPPLARTANRRVTSPRDITRQLAVAGYGAPDLEKWTGLTRLVSAWGDEWL